MNTKEALEIIKNAQIVPESKREKVLLQLRKIVGNKTGNFSNHNSISTTKIDMSPVIQERAIDKETYIREFGSIKRSENDVVLHLAENLKKYSSVNETDEIKNAISDLKDYLSILDDKNEIREIKQAIADLQDYLSIL